MSLEASKLVLLARICESGSLTSVALKTGIARSSVSYQLEQLREDLPDRLFVKVGRNLEPAPFLRQRMPAILRVVAELQSLPKRTAFDPETHSGRLIVLANVTEQMPWLVELTRKFRERAPLATPGRKGTDA